MTKNRKEKITKRKIKVLRLNSGQAKTLAKEVSIRIGATGLAILTGLAEGFLTWFDDTVNRRSFSQILNKAQGSKTFYDYYEDYIEILRGTKKNTLNVSLYRLKQKGLIEKVEVGYILTSLGEKLLAYRKGGAYYKWDGKYRIVIFDIPEFLRRERNWLRLQLKILGYKLLQKSVFIGKRPLPVELMEEIINKKLYSYVRILTVGEIDNDDILKNLS